MQLTIPPALQKSLAKILPFTKRYAVFIVILIFLGVYVFEVNRIGHLIQDEPSQSAIDDKLKPVSQLKIDQNAIQQINDLETQNIQVKSLFDQARDNPFSE